MYVRALWINCRAAHKLLTEEGRKSGRTPTLSFSPYLTNK